jgi:hypothetical protein
MFADVRPDTTAPREKDIARLLQDRKSLLVIGEGVTCPYTDLEIYLIIILVTINHINYPLDLPLSRFVLQTPKQLQTLQVCLQNRVR